MKKNWELNTDVWIEASETYVGHGDQNGMDSVLSQKGPKLDEKTAAWLYTIVILDSTLPLIL